MSDTRTTWIQTWLPVLAMVGVVFGTWLSMSNQSAVRGEQIRRIQDDARKLESDWEKHAGSLEADDETNANRIRLVERDVDGLVPVVNEIKKLADSNSLKLDALLGRGRVSNTGLVSARDESR